MRELDGRIDTTVFPAELPGETANLPEARGLPRPDLVLPNYNDLAYAKVSLDDTSVAFVREKIDLIDDLLTRSLLWSATWNMVRDQQLKSRDFLSLVRKKIPAERSTELVDSVLAQALTAITRYVSDEHRESEAHALFDTAWAALAAAEAPDARIIWARTIFRSATVPEDVLRAGRLADGEEAIPGVTIDQDMRWECAARFASLGLPGWQQRIEAELERDPSDRGQRARLRCETADPRPEVKAAAWEKFNGEGYGSQYLTSAAMSGFLWWRQRELLDPYVERFFTAVTGIFESRDKEFASEYFRHLFPGHLVEQRILDRSEVLLAETGDEMAMLRRMLREANDDLARSIRCREYDVS
jgi:aminopeptidase N